MHPRLASSGLRGNRFAPTLITDLGEDARFRNRQGDELPDWVANKVERQKKIREAKAALEKEAADKAKADRKDDVSPRAVRSMATRPRPMPRMVRKAA